eukprot:2253730-Rhodomonas_salina.1
MDRPGYPSPCPSPYSEETSPGTDCCGHPRSKTLTSRRVSRLCCVQPQTLESSVSHTLCPHALPARIGKPAHNASTILKPAPDVSHHRHMLSQHRPMDSRVRTRAQTRERSKESCLLCSPSSDLDQTSKARERRGTSPDHIRQSWAGVEIGSRDRDVSEVK